MSLAMMSVCLYCGKHKDDELLICLDQKCIESDQREAVGNMEPCIKCKKEFKENDLIIILEAIQSFKKMSKKSLEEEKLFIISEDIKSKQYIYSTGKYIIIPKGILNVSEEKKSGLFALANKEMFKEMIEELNDFKKITEGKIEDE